MKPTTYFVLSVGGPILGGAMTVSSIYTFSDWLQEHGVQPLLLAFVGFILGWLITRWLVHHIATVSCPKCGARSHEMEGGSNRFHCRVCGKTF